MEVRTGNSEATSHSDRSDPVRDLNDRLKDHSTGNLTPYLSWALSQEGPDHQKIHFATARFNGRDIGSGRGFSKGLAKREAAIRALKFMESIRIETLLQ